MIAFRIVALLGLLGQAPQERPSVPPSLGPKNCQASTQRYDRPAEEFETKGGRVTQMKVRREISGAYTVDDVAQGRDLQSYDKLELPNPGLDQRALLSVQSSARTFVWEHWRGHKPAYLIITFSSVDATSTSHIFVEPDESSRWRVAWRIVRHDGEVDDAPTDYSVEWVSSNGWNKPGTLLPSGQTPDPAKHNLEFRDKCGDLNGSL